MWPCGRWKYGQNYLTNYETLKMLSKDSKKKGVLIELYHIEKKLGDNPLIEWGYQPKEKFPKTFAKGLRML